MNETPASQLPAKREAPVEYIPHGAQDKIKLSVSIVQNLIAVKTKSGKTCSERDAIRFLAMCQAKRLNPFEGDCFLIGYDSKDGPTFALVTGHQTYLKRAETHQEFDGMESGVIVLGEDGKLKDLEGDFYEQGQQVVGGWAKVHFKTRKFPMVKRLRMSTFNKGFGQWNDNPNGMIVKCAEADALRSAFPTMLGGLYLREEMDLGKPEFTKPEFGKPGTFLASAATQSITDAQAGVGSQSEPQAEPEPEPASEPEAAAPLKRLRELCVGSKVKEGALLTFLAKVGTTDGSIESLEELQLQNSDIVQVLIRDWPNIVNQMAGGAK